MKTSVLMCVVLVGVILVSGGCGKVGREAVKAAALLGAEKAASQALDEATAQSLDPGWHRWQEINVSGINGRDKLRVTARHLSGPPIDVLLLSKSEYERFKSGRTSSHRYFIEGSKLGLDGNYDSGPISLADGTYVVVADNGPFGNAAPYEGTAKYKLAVW